MVKRDLRQIAVAFVAGLVLAVAAIHMTGCKTQGTADARVRSALDAFAVVVDPAYSFAVDACATRQEHVAEEVEAGRLKPAEADVVLRPIRARCHATRQAFDAIRASHDQAAQLVEDGELQKAEAVLDDIRARWLELKGDVP